MEELKLKQKQSYRLSVAFLSTLDLNEYTELASSAC
jgi:hypothetical protein